MRVVPFLFLAFVGCGVSILEVKLEPSGCLCPGRVKYECHVYGAHSLAWHSNHHVIEYSNRDRVGKTFESDSLTAILTDKVPNMFTSVNYTSTMRVHRHQLNGTKLTCTGLLSHGSGAVKDSHNDSTNICIKGVSSGPSNMSVEWNVSSAVGTVQFHPPVYGAECVVGYTVKAERGEKQVMCTATYTEHLEQTYTCQMPEVNVMGYVFTAEAITPGSSGALYHANSSVQCFSPFPANITVSKIRGFRLHYDITWDVHGQDGISPQQVVVTWRRVQSRGGYSTAAHHDIATTEGYFHLVLDQNMTGLVELSVSFHDDHCMKQSSVQFEVNSVEVLMDMIYSPKNETLTVLCSNCFHPYYNYTITIAYSASLNVHFSRENMVDLGLVSAAPLNLTATITESTSGVVVEKYIGNYTLPQHHATDLDFNESEARGQDVHTMYTAYGVVGGIFIGIILGTAGTLAIMIFVKKSKSNATRMCGLVCQCCTLQSHSNKQLQVPVYEEVDNNTARGTASGGIELKSNEAYSLRKT